LNEPPIQRRFRRIRVRLAGRFDGVAGATLTITVDGPSALLSVRPLGSRREYTGDLAAVAHRLIYDAHRTANPIRAGALRPHEPQPKPTRKPRP
jgi:hypothetical protein